MKKILILVASMLLSIGVASATGYNYGVVGGAVSATSGVEVSSGSYAAIGGDFVGVVTTYSHAGAGNISHASVRGVQNSNGVAITTKAGTIGGTITKAGRSIYGYGEGAEGKAGAGAYQHGKAKAKGFGKFYAKNHYKKRRPPHPPQEPNGCVARHGPPLNCGVGRGLDGYNGTLPEGLGPRKFDDDDNGDD